MSVALVNIQALRGGTRVALGFFNSHVACSGGYVKQGALDSYGHRDSGAQPCEFVASDVSVEVVLLVDCW